MTPDQVNPLQFQCFCQGNTGGIYALIENRPGHKYYGLPRYIGQSVNIKNRWLKGHMTNKRNNHKNHIIAAHREIGVSVLVKTLVVCEEYDLDYYERLLIAAHRSTVCNFSEGGKRADSIAGGKLSHIGRQFQIDHKIGAMSLEHKSKMGRLSVLNGTAAMSIESKRAQGKAAASSGQLSKALQKFQQNKLQEQKKLLVSAGLPEDYRPSRQEAKKYGLKFYYGKTCKHHPEIVGKRYFGGSDGCCVYCISRGKK